MLLPPIIIAASKNYTVPANWNRSEWDPIRMVALVSSTSLPFRDVRFFSPIPNSAVRWVFLSRQQMRIPDRLEKKLSRSFTAPRFFRKQLLVDASFKLTGREAKLKTWWTEGRTVNSRAFPSRRYLKIEVEEKRKIFPFFFFFFFFDEFTPAMIMDWPQGFNDRAIPIRGYTNDCRTMTMSRKWDVMYTRRGKKNFQRCSKGPIVFKSYF